MGDYLNFCPTGWTILQYSFILDWLVTIELIELEPIQIFEFDGIEFG